MITIRFDSAIPMPCAVCDTAEEAAQVLAGLTPPQAAPSVKELLEYSRRQTDALEQMVAILRRVPLQSPALQGGKEESKS